MGRWTVAEWQAQIQQYDYPLPGGMDVDVYPRHINAVAEDDDEYEDEDEDIYGKALPASPRAAMWGRDAPPTPPPKALRATTHEFRTVASPPSAGYVHRLFGAMRKPGPSRGKRDNLKPDTDTPMTNDSEQPRWTPQRNANYEYEPPRRVLGAPTTPMLRSPDTPRSREFVARSGLKRTKSKSKATRAGSARTAEHGDGPGYIYNGQGLEIFVSTQTTATASAPDARRPRLFFPRSSSLAAMRKNAIPPPPPPKPEINSVLHAARSPRALPALPSRSGADPRTNNNAHTRRSSKGSNRGVRRIRPLPVPEPMGSHPFSPP
ncbi:hypothetical protein C8R44DRAFT_175959 [Mycena epipterygia]|nr:hypothetical protein C8R44DRAFT_175959 [Mycena epipterygia]